MDYSYSQFTDPTYFMRFNYPAILSHNLSSWQLRLHKLYQTQNKKLMISRYNIRNIQSKEFLNITLMISTITFSDITGLFLGLCKCMLI